MMGCLEFTVETLIVPVNKCILSSQPPTYTMHPDHRHHPNDRSTPPFSPRAPVPSQSTLQLVDSLVSFYRQEMMWVYRMRAALELADPLTGANVDNDAAEPSVSDTLPSTFAVEEEPKVVVKTETPITPTTPPSRWHRRKHKFKLKLGGLPPAPRRETAYGVSDSGMRVLELFESMMEARMESCQRVNRLVRMANRANLYVR